jgi:hypothetical protein
MGDDFISKNHIDLFPEERLRHRPIGDDWGMLEWGVWKRQDAFRNIEDKVHDVPHPQLVQEVRDLLDELSRLTDGRQGSGFRGALNETRAEGTLSKTFLERARGLITDAVRDAAAAKVL